MHGIVARGGFRDESVGQRSGELSVRLTGPSWDVLADGYRPVLAATFHTQPLLIGLGGWRDAWRQRYGRVARGQKSSACPSSTDYR